MNDTEKKTRIEKALNNHGKGYNCAQSVACAFSDLAGLDEKTLFRLTEGLGLGMGCMDGTCGAVSAACTLAGLVTSTGNLEHPDSKGNSYRVSRACLTAFKEKNGSAICRELKGVDTSMPLRSCDGCIEDAVAIIAEQLF